MWLSLVSYLSIPRYCEFFSRYYYLWSVSGIQEADISEHSVTPEWEAIVNLQVETTSSLTQFTRMWDEGLSAKSAL